jgi:hypothetical protein
MPTLLKTHGRPVLHGIVSSAIFQILWHGVSAVVGYVAGHFASIRGLAPQWAILIGAVVFFLLALAYNLLTGRRQVQQSDEIPEAILTRDSDQNCKEAWLHNIAEYEKTAIHNRVRVPECKVRNLLFDESPIEILFYISILNSSVYPVILEEAANPGRIKHVRKPFLYPPAVEDNNWECQHGNS